MKRRRVIVWGTGRYGREALNIIAGRPDIELVGLHAHSPQKIGRLEDMKARGRTDVQKLDLPCCAATAAGFNPPA